MASGFAQGTPDPSDLDAYTAAARKPTAAERIMSLEQFAGKQTGLRADALELLLWTYVETGNDVQAAMKASQLLAADPGNALAVAVLAGADPVAHGDEAARALDSTARLRKPAGVSDSEFAAMSTRTAGLLHAAAGMAALQQKHYDAARAHLKQALATRGDDSRYTYALALADLLGPKPDVREGYWYMARTVVLTQDTPAGRKIADYARIMYQQAGGTSTDWDQFIVAASAGAVAPAAATEMAKAAPPDSKRPEAHAAHRRRAEPVKAAKVERAQPKPGARELETRGATDAASVNSAAAEMASNLPLGLPADVGPRAPLPPGATPFSLGILIEASMTDRDTRAALLDSLSNIVRQLRVRDEAFIVSYGSDIDFKADLTDDRKQLEHALAQIRPHRGDALFDAVSFAAGHLKRVARNDKRVLLVISDGRDDVGKASARLGLSSAIDAVQVYCIGVGAGGTQQNALQALANRTGGIASFVGGPAGLEEASRTIAGMIYGPER